MTTSTANKGAEGGGGEVNLLRALIRPLSVLLPLLVLWLTVSAASAAQGDQGAPLIAPEQALILLESPDTIFIDVRSVASYQESGVRIPGSQWRHPHKPEQWLADYPRDKTLILYCV